MSQVTFLISVLWDRKIQNEKTMPVPVYESLNIKLIQIYISQTCVNVDTPPKELESSATKSTR